MIYIVDRGKTNSICNLSNVNPGFDSNSEESLRGFVGSGRAEYCCRKKVMDTTARLLAEIKMTLSDVGGLRNEPGKSTDESKA